MVLLSKWRDGASGYAWAGFAAMGNVEPRDGDSRGTQSGCKAIFLEVENGSKKPALPMHLPYSVVRKEICLACNTPPHRMRLKARDADASPMQGLKKRGA